MRGITHQEHAVAAPLARDAMVDAVDDGVEDLQVVDGTDEANDLLAELGSGGLGHSRGKRVEKAPAMRLAHQDHPLAGIGEIGEIGIVARIGDVEVDLDVDQQDALVRRLAFNRDAELGTHRAAPAVAGEEMRAFDLATAVRRVKYCDDPVVGLTKGGELVPQMQRARPALLNGRAQDRLEVMLRHVDDEWIARIFAQQRRLHGGARLAGRTLHIADLVDAQRSGQDLVGDTVSAKGLERAREYRSRFGVERQLGVILEQRERQTIEIEPQRGGKTDRACANDDDGRLAHASPSWAG